MNNEKQTLEDIFKEMKNKLFKLKEKNSNLRIVEEENEFFAALEKRHGSEGNPIELRVGLQKETIKVCLWGNGLVEDEFFDFKKAFDVFIKAEEPFRD